jgi:hypothetical protein
MADCASEIDSSGVEAGRMFAKAILIVLMRGAPRVAVGASKILAEGRRSREFYPPVAKPG